MSLLGRIAGPASKYDRRLPYTYEARIPVPDVGSMTQTYFADTLCALLDRLDHERVRPEETRLFEVRPEGSFPVALAHCVDAAGKWLHRPEACRSFQEHYAGHVEGGRCCYLDRSRDAEGPFVEVDAEAPNPAASR